MNEFNETHIFISLVHCLYYYASKPKLLLLKTYKDQNTTNWVMSEKLDGIRAYWDGKQLLTRNGKKISCTKMVYKRLSPVLKLMVNYGLKEGTLKIFLLLLEIKYLVKIGPK